MLVFTACLIASWQCMQSTFLSVTCCLCMKSMSVNRERRFSSLWHRKHRSFFASPVPWIESRWQFWHATCRDPTKSLWLNVMVPNLMSFSGALWHLSPQPPIGFISRPSTAPRKWHRKQVLSVTSMWFPTTIWLWQLVHRLLPPFHVGQVGLVVELDPPCLKVTVPLEEAGFVASLAQARLVADLRVRLRTVRPGHVLGDLGEGLNFRIILSRTSGG